LFLAWLSVDYVSPTNNKANGRLNYLTNWSMPGPFTYPNKLLFHK
jgi:hypothetical protein